MHTLFTQLKQIVQIILAIFAYILVAVWSNALNILIVLLIASFFVGERAREIIKVDIAAPIFKAMGVILAIAVAFVVLFAIYEGVRKVLSYLSGGKKVTQQIM